MFQLPTLIITKIVGTNAMEEDNDCCHTGTAQKESGHLLLSFDAHDTEDDHSGIKKVGWGGGVRHSLLVSADNPFVSSE